MLGPLSRPRVAIYHLTGDLGFGFLDRGGFSCLLPWVWQLLGPVRLVPSLCPRLPQWGGNRRGWSSCKVLVMGTG